MHKHVDQRTSGSFHDYLLIRSVPPTAAIRDRMEHVTELP